MDMNTIEQHMEKFGSRIQLEYETQNYDGVRLKTGTISGTMISYTGVMCVADQYS